jgi:hypothetical protein
MYNIRERQVHKHVIYALLNMREWANTEDAAVRPCWIIMFNPQNEVATPTAGPWTEMFVLTRRSRWG